MPTIFTDFLRRISAPNNTFKTFPCFSLNTIFRDHVNSLKQQAISTSAIDEYVQQQYTLTNELDALTPDPGWRLLISSMTVRQITEAGPEITRLIEAFNMFALLSELNQESTKESEQDGMNLLREGHKRYKEELATLQPATSRPLVTS